MGTWHCTWLGGMSFPGLTSLTNQLHNNNLGGDVLANLRAARNLLLVFVTVAIN